MMKYNKLKAFTLAEIMILLLTLSILLAAFAPVFTRRYSNAGSDDVWAYVVSDDNFDAYYDVISDNFTAQAFIGLTPKDKFQVQKFSSDEGNNILYSKVVIAPSKALSSGRGVQRQMQFRYGNNNGSSAGFLFAAKGNILVGGDYSSVGDAIAANTSFGSLSLDSVKNTGTVSKNTAIGSGSLAKLTSSGGNTAIGANTARLGNIGDGNTLVGYNSALNVNTTDFLYNTAVGLNSMVSASDKTTYNTAFGNYTHGGSGAGDSNVSVGYSALARFGSGTGNTAIGAHAMSNLTSGSYNTAIGYNSCGKNSSGSYITCLGANAGSELPKSGSSGIYTGNTTNDEIVLIGSRPLEDGSFLKDAAAVLEVHNKQTINSNSSPMPNVGNESVVINGNLVVRGQSYLEVPIIRPYNTGDDLKSIPKGLVAFKLNKNENAKGTHSSLYAFSGYDGAQRQGNTKDYCDRRCKWHVFEQIRTNAICTIVAGKASNGDCTPASTNMAKNSFGPSKSYDWSSTTNRTNIINDDNCDSNSTSSSMLSYYADESYGCKMKLERYQSAGAPSVDDGKGAGVDKSLAHMAGVSGGSPCPNLSSDRRLKNVGDKFIAGLDEIRKLHIYNYTFKNDPNKLPQVGVIAQELKLVFPNAVTKGEDGYYKIRWDEMLYAAINSIKTLNAKIEKLASRIATDRNRVAVLKKDNAELNSKLDSLANELTLLEAKKRK